MCWFPWKKTHHPDHSQDHSYDYYTKSEKFDRVVLKSPKGHIESILLFVRLSRISSAISPDLTVPSLSTDRSVFGSGYTVYHRKLQEVFARRADRRST